MGESCNFHDRAPYLMYDDLLPLLITTRTVQHRVEPIDPNPNEKRSKTREAWEVRSREQIVCPACATA